MAGKTGTAEVYGKQDTSVFVGDREPEPQDGRTSRSTSIAVFVEQGGTGGSVAAPIARRIADGLSGEIDPTGVRLVPRRHGLMATHRWHSRPDLAAALCEPRRTRRRRGVARSWTPRPRRRLDWVLIGAVRLASP